MALGLELMALGRELGAIVRQRGRGGRFVILSFCGGDDGGSFEGHGFFGGLRDQACAAIEHEVDDRSR